MELIALPLLIVCPCFCLPAVCCCGCAENDYRSDAFTSSHIQLLQLLCSQAALSIDNARLYGALSEYNASLEQQVHGRTAELEQKNKQLSMAKEVAEAATKAKADFLSNMVRAASTSRRDPGGQMGGG